MMMHMGYRQAQGFSLIELLVAVVIMAVGILGVAGLQVVSLQQNRSALYRAEAVQLANDIVDRMRVNKNVTYTALIDAAPASTTDCEVNACTPTQMKDYDVAQWKCSINSYKADGTDITACTQYMSPDGVTKGIKGALPEGEGSVEFINNTDPGAMLQGEYVVKVQWVDDSDGNTASIEVRAQVK